jgi:hypothetical protein
MKHINKAIVADKVEYLQILGTIKENALVRTRGKSLYAVTEITKRSEVKTYFVLRVNGKLTGIYYNLEQATHEYNNK